MKPGIIYRVTILLMFLLHWPGYQELYAQQKTIDSLTAIINSAPDDTLKLDLMYHRNRPMIIGGQYDQVLIYLDEMQELANNLAKKYPKAQYSNRLKSETARIQNMKGVVYHRQSKYPEALESYFASLKAREEMGDKRGIAMACNNIYGVYSVISDGPNQLKYLDKAIENFEAIGDKTGMGQGYFNLSVYYFKQSQFDKAVESNLKALKYSEEAGDKVGITHCLIHSGAIYDQLNNDEKAVEYYNRALQLTSETGDKVGMVYIYTNLGIVYKRTGSYEAAFDSYQKVLTISLELRSEKHIGDAYFHIGSWYRAMLPIAEAANDSVKANVYADSAISNYMRAHQLFEKLEEKGENANTMLEIGDLLIFKGKYQEAEQYLQRGLQMSEQSGERRDRLTAYLKLSELYEAKGYSKEALRYHMLYSSLKDSIFNENSAKVTLELDKKFESERKEKQIALLEKQGQIDRIELKLNQELINKQELLNRDKSQQLLLVSKDNAIKDLTLQRQETELTQRKTLFAIKQGQVSILKRESELQQLSLQKASQQRQFAIAGIIALIVFGSITYYRYRQRKRLSDCLAISLAELKKTQQQLIEIEKRREQEKIRLRISRDIHDEIGSNLTKISLLSEMMNASNGNIPVPLKKSVSDIAHYAQEVNESLSEIVWAVNPGQDSVESLLAYMRNHIHDFLNDTGIDYEINFPEVHDDSDLDPELKRSIYLVLKESLNNAVKYSNASKITVDFQMKDAAFELSVKDDGDGFDPSATDRFGNGLNNMQYRMEHSGCNFSIFSSPGNGCKVIVWGNLKTIADNNSKETKQLS